MGSVSMGIKPKESKVVYTIIELIEAINNAGGRVNIKNLLKMSVGDFIADIAAPNDIHFKYIPPVKYQSDHKHPSE